MFCHAHLIKDQDGGLLHHCACKSHALLFTPTEAHPTLSCVKGKQPQLLFALSLNELFGQFGELWVPTCQKDKSGKLQEPRVSKAALVKGS
eukprot:1139836-Pelagomonas_calceolata.AAC.1